MRRTDRPINEVSLGDVTVDLSHDIVNAMDLNPPVGGHDSPADSYRHGVADGVRWLIETLLVGSKNPNEVVLTDEHLEILSGVMTLYGERGVMCATLTLNPVGECPHGV